MKNKSLSLTAANGLYLAAMALVVSLGAWMQSRSAGWGLIATEVLCIFLPSVYLLWRSQTLPAAGAQIHTPNWKITLVSGLIGVGAWFVGQLIDAVFSSLFAYTPAFTSGLIPSTPGQAVLLFLGLVVFAPLCEETLFRGTLQPAYERYGALVGVTVPSLLFAFFHLRLIGLPALLPVAFFLGFTYYRTRSLEAAMVLHAGNNLLAALVAIGAGLFPERLPQVDWLTAAAFGLILVVTGLILLTRLTVRPVIAREAQPVLRPWAWLALLAAGLIYAAAVILSGEAHVVGRTLFPQRQPLSLQLGESLPQGTYTYELRNRLDEPVGQMICTFSADAAQINLFCDTTIEAFEIQVGNSYYASGNLQRTLTAAWEVHSLNLLQAQMKTNPIGGGWQLERGDDGGLVLSGDSLDGLYPVAEGALLPDTAAFQLIFLPWQAQPAQYTAQMIWPARWDNSKQAAVTAQEAVVIDVQAAQSLNLPAGDLTAAPVKIGAELAAWYADSGAHIPVKMQDNIFDYLLLAE
jgi:membrane protease YdiL (CAAX protease family)